MSLAFSNTTTKDGIIQAIEREIGSGDGGISGNATKLAEFTADINIALDRAFSIIFNSGGTWQFDDSNHTKYPIIKTNLESGRQDYQFTSDGQSNLILDIYKVAILPSATAVLFQEIFPVDVQSENGAIDILTENTASGTPFYYDKTANGIFLSPPPSYNSTNGLKIYINREGSYFTTSDSTKKPGFAGLYHEYLVLNPAAKYAARKGLANAKSLRQDVLDMEKALSDYYGMREKDTRPCFESAEIQAF